MSSPVQINRKRFIKLYGFGLTDQRIAQELGLKRLTVLRYRRRLDFAPNVKRGQRGVMPPHPHKPYYKEVRRICCHKTLKALNDAAAIYRKNGGCKETSYNATLVAPTPIPTGHNSVYVSDPDKMDLTDIRWIFHFEERIDKSVTVSVPGPAIFALAHAVRRKKTKAIPLLAMEAVKQTKTISEEAPTSFVMNDGKWLPGVTTTPSDNRVNLVMEIMKAFAWAPVKQDKKRRTKKTKIKKPLPMSGKVTRNGGRLSQARQLAFTAISGV